MVGQRPEQGLDRVENDPLGADCIDRRTQADKEAFQVVFAGFEKLGSVENDVLDGIPLAASQAGEIEAQRECILREIVGTLL